MTDEYASLAADVVLFAHDEDGLLHVLLIERGWDPYAGCWALPGGYVDAGETFEQAARRELVEETGITAPDRLAQVGVYDAPNRDPRGRVVSVAYTGELDSLVIPTAGDDAKAAVWHPFGDVDSRVTPLAFDHLRIVREAYVACEQMNTLPGGHSAKNAHQAGAPNTRESGEILMVGTPARPGQAAHTAPNGAEVRP